MIINKQLLICTASPIYYLSCWRGREL